MSSASAVRAAKKQLRQNIRQALSALSADAAAQQTCSAVKTLLSMPEYQVANKIGVYLSMPTGEVSTSDIVEHALKQGKKVYVPYTYKLGSAAAGHPSAVMDMLELNSFDDFQSLLPDKWGIPTPTETSVAGRRNCFGGYGKSQGDLNVELNDETWKDGGLDLIVVPGMAFDVGLRRLGHGKGFYDYFFDRYSKHTKRTDDGRMPFLVGLSLTEQLLPAAQEVPVDDSDWRLHALVVGDGRLLRQADE